MGIERVNLGFASIWEDPESFGRDSLFGVPLALVEQEVGTFGKRTVGFHRPIWRTFAAGTDIFCELELDQKLAGWGQGALDSLEQLDGLAGCERIEFAKEHQDKVETRSEFGSPYIHLSVVAPSTLLARLVSRILNGRGGKVEASTLMASLGQTLCVKTWTASEIEDFARSSVEQRLMKPGHLSINDVGTTAGTIMILGKVDIEHAAAECRVVPGESSARCEWNHGWTVDERLNFHVATLLLFAQRVR